MNNFFKTWRSGLHGEEPAWIQHTHMVFFCQANLGKKSIPIFFLSFWKSEVNLHWMCHCLRGWIWKSETRQRYSIIQKELQIQIQIIGLFKKPFTNGCRTSLHLKFRNQCYTWIFRLYFSFMAKEKMLVRRGTDTSYTSSGTSKSIMSANHMQI